MNFNFPTSPIILAWWYRVYLLILEKQGKSKQKKKLFTWDKYKPYFQVPSAINNIENLYLYLSADLNILDNS